MLGQGLLLAGVGLALGMAGAIVLTRTLAGLIYGVGGPDRNSSPELNKYVAGAPEPPQH